MLQGRVSKIKKIILFIVLLFFICMGGESAWATNRIFLLDTSGSMQKERLFDRLKETLKEDYILKAKTGERITILTFDEKISILLSDREIISENDTNQICSLIDGLDARGPWTWMTKALEETIGQADLLKSKYPQEDLIIYFFTDGVNEPSPNANEPTLKFVEVMSRCFKNFECKDTYIYVFLYQVSGSPSIEETKKDIENKKIPVKINPSTPTNPISPEIKIKTTGFDFGPVNLTKSDLIGKATILIQEARGPVQGKTVNLSCKTSALPLIKKELGIEPQSFTIEGEGQEIEVGLRKVDNLSEGKHELPLILSSTEKIRIIPRPVIPVSFEVPKGPPQNGWINLLGIILFIPFLLALIYFLYLYLRQKDVWIKDEMSDEVQKIKVRGLKKKSLDVLGLPDCKLQLGFYPGAVFLFKEHSKEKIQWDKPVDCMGKSIIFYPKPLQDQVESPNKSNAGKKEEEDPDFYK